jgi:YbbR domain-containing protein
MTNVLRQLWNNLSSILLALLLAVAVWITATLQADPFAVQEFAGVPVTPVNQPENTVLFEGDSARVTVRVRAPETVLAELKLSDFSAVMNLAQVSPGISSSVPITVTCSNDAVRIESYDPHQETVHLEAVSTITLPVQIQVVGQVATGYLSTLPVATPQEVSISGPVPYLANVVSVVGSVDVEGAREDVVKMVPVQPQGADGTLVSGVQWSPEQVEVRIGVRRRVGYKPDVEVVPDVRGDPATGYRRGSVSVEPSTVTLAGPPAVLDELPGFVRTLPVSIMAATEVLTVHVPLTVPTNVVVVGVNYVTVTVDILPILGSRTLTDVVEIQGLSQGLAAALSPGEVDVILEGPDSLLAELAPGDIQVYVNLFGLGLGTHRVPPVVLAPAGIRVVSVIPETIEVVISLPPTPVPGKTPSPAGPGP